MRSDGAGGLQRCALRCGRAALVAVLAAGVANANAAAAEAPQIVQTTCGVCHTLAGISESDRFPSLAGQPRDYLLAQLRAFRDGRRHNDGGMMRSTAELLSDGEIAAAATYYSAQPAPVAGPRDITREAWYRRGDLACGVPPCAACHGAVGQGAARVPRLAGQRPAYILKQMRDFAAGRRASGAAAVMVSIARRLKPPRAGLTTCNDKL